MKKLIGLLQWTLKAAIFFTLFAFALNNQHDVTVHFFFGQHWMAPQVLVLLAVFVLGLVLGVLLMVPKRQPTNQSQSQKNLAQQSLEY